MHFACNFTEFCIPYMGNGYMNVWPRYQVLEYFSLDAPLPLFFILLWVSWQWVMCVICTGITDFLKSITD